MKEFPEKNPWLGLRTYTEGQYLYGRASEIESLSRDITYNRQTVVYGKSGIGKSSLLNAGVFPRLRKLNMFPVNVRLVHKTVEQSYIQQIASAVEDSLSHLRREVIDEDGKILIRENLKGHSNEVCPLMGNEGQESLWEYFHRHKFYDDQDKEIIPVLVIDQFEEIFTLCKEEKQKNFFFGELADLINDVPPEYVYSDTSSSSANDSYESLVIDGNEEFILTEDEDSKKESVYKFLDDPQFHIVICLREDFLSYLERYTINIPLLKHNRFCLRPLDDDHAAEIILEPVPGLISKDVAVDVICKVSNVRCTDFIIGDSISQIEVDSAILSLFLSELFEQRKSAKSTISKELVEEIGDNIIRNFYERTISNISESSALYLENELISEDGETARRDSIFENQAKLNGVTNEELNYLKEERLIHEYPWNNDIRIEFIHDVLCPVIKERKEKRDMLRQQEYERRRQEEEKRQLQIEAERKQREIEEKAAREKAELETEAIRIKKRNKKRLVSIAAMGFIAVLVIIAYFVYDHYYNEYVFEDYYANYDNNKGWPTGINPISRDEAEHTAKYYKLSYKGYKNREHYTDVEVMSSNKYLADDCRIPCLEWTSNETIDTKAKAYNDILRQIVKIHFSATEDGKSVSKEDYFNEKGELLLTKTYYHINSNDAYIQYMTPKGESMKIRQNGIDRVKVNWDNNGHVASMSYYDGKGVQKNILIGTDITGFLWDYSKSDTIVRYALNQYGIPSGSILANTNFNITRGDSNITIFSNSAMVYQSQINEVACERGYSRVIKTANSTRLYDKDSQKQAVREYEYDDYGNIKSVKTHGDKLFGYPEVINYKYSDGRKIFEEHLDSSGEPYKNNAEGLYHWEYSYRANCDINEEKHYKYDKTLVYHYKESSSILGNIQVNVKSRLDLNDSIAYVERIDSIYSKGKSVISYYGENKVPINRPYSFGTDTMTVHRIVITDTPGKKIQEFYISNENGIVAMPTYLFDNYLAVNYFRRTEEYDKDGNITSLCLQDVDNNIIKNMIYYYQNGTKVGRAAKSIIDGKPVRCDRWEEEGFCYYKLYYNKNYEDVYYAVHTVDEWNNRSSFFNGSIYLTGENKQFKNEFFEMSNQLLKFNNSYEQFCFDEDLNISDLGLPYIHILSKSSHLYNKGKGVRDGDRIIKLRSWQIGMNERDFIREWTYSLSKGTFKCQILRPIEAGYKLIDIDLPISSSEKNYIECHFIMMTNNEKEIISSYLN